MTELKKKLDEGICPISVVVRNKEKNKVWANGAITDFCTDPITKQTIYALWDSDEPGAWLLVESEDGTVRKIGPQFEPFEVIVEVVED